MLWAERAVLRTHDRTISTNRGRKSAPLVSSLVSRRLVSVDGRQRVGVRGRVN